MKHYFFGFLFFCMAYTGTAQHTNFSLDSSRRLPVKEKGYFTIRNTVVPSAFFMYGLLRNDVKSIKTLDVSTRNEILQHNHSFPTHIDDYMQWVPTVSVFALDGFGVRTAHTFTEQLFLQLSASVIVTATVTPLKHVFHTTRPDGSANNSFPSGHTATAFVGAEVLHQELMQSHPWWSYSGYVVASATGIYRMYNNRHWLSDVVAGAGLGILSTKCSYWIFNKIKSGKERRRHTSALAF